MPVTVVGIFHSVKAAEVAKHALLAAGVLEPRIALDVKHDGACMVHVHAESSLERERIADVLRRHGAAT